MQKETIRKNKTFPTPITAYKYQVPIIKKIVERILEGKNGLVIQPTATGKSIEAAFVSRICILLNGMRGLYLYNENEGLYQARNKFEYIFGKNDIVCSSFFGNQRDFDVDKADMVFASFQSLNNHRQKWYELFDKNHFDFIIVNEGHHSSAVTYREVIDYFNCSKIAMTATPKRMDGKDILHIFEEVIYEMSLEEAIARAWVAKVEYHICSHGISSQKLKKICAEVLEEGKRITIKQLNETIFVKKLNESILEEIYKHAFPQYETPLQTIIFCENIKHAEETIAILKDSKKSVEIIHSKKTSIHNHNALENFKENKFQFLIVVDKLNEDIDIPNVELAVFLRATDSQTVFLQQLGRVLRRTKLKDTAIILDFVANCERLLMVNEMMEKISNFSQQIGKNTESDKNNKKQLEKGLLYVSGEGHDFIVEKGSVVLYDLLKRINVDFYETWQEASDAAKKIDIFNSTEYFILKRFREDPKLPSNPSVVYKNFPGWAIFLGNEIPPDGWISASEISRINNLYISFEVIKGFIDKFRIKNPEWFKRYSSVKGRKIEYYHPELIKLISNEFKNKKLCPNDDWLLLNSISTKLNITTKVTKGIIGLLKLDKSKSLFIQRFMNESHKLFYYYHISLIPKIEEVLEKRKSKSDGWRSTTSLRKEKDLVVAFDAVKLFTNQFRKTNPEWFDMFYVSGRLSEHYHPDLVKKVFEEFGVDKRPKAPKGWMTAKKISETGILVKTSSIKKFVEQFRLINTEWFKDYWTESFFTEHYHPNLVKKVLEEFGVDKRQKAPIGWVTANSFRPNLHVKGNRIKKFTDQFKDKHPEWFKDYLTNKGNKFLEHYHPDLVEKIKECFKKE